MISGETSGAVSSGDQDGVCKNRVATRTESTVLREGRQEPGLSAEVDDEQLKTTHERRVG